MQQQDLTSAVVKRIYPVAAGSVAAFIYTLFVLSKPAVWLNSNESVWNGCIWLDGSNLAVSIFAAALTALFCFIIGKSAPAAPAMLSLLFFPAAALCLPLEPFLRLPLFLIIQFPYVLPILLISASLYLSRKTIHPAKWIPLEDPGGSWILFVLVFTASVWAACDVFPHLSVTGDEPQYFKIADSIASDFDLNLVNQEPGYSKYWPGDWCRLHHTIPRPNGTLRSIHAPGLPFLIAFPAAKWGRYGAALVMALIAAFLAVFLYHLMAVAARKELAWGLTLACLLGTPLIFHAIQFYPELPAALITAIFLFTASKNTSAGISLPLASLAVAALPWLHTKYGLLAAGMTLFLTYQHRRSPGKIIAAGLLPLISAMAILLYHYVTFGSPTPFAAYSEYVQKTSLLETNPIFGLGYLLLDPRHSLFLFAPLYLFAPAGLTALRRRNAPLAAACLLTVLLHLPIIAGHVSERWLGWSPPCRFWVPILPALAISTAAFAESRWSQTLWRWIILWTALLQCTIAWLMIRYPALIHQRNRLFEPKLNGFIHPGAIWPMIPQNTSPWLLLLIAMAVFTIFVAALVLTTTTDPGKLPQKQPELMQITRFTALIAAILLIFGAFHAFARKNPGELNRKAHELFSLCRRASFSPIQTSLVWRFKSPELGRISFRQIFNLIAPREAEPIVSENQLTLSQQILRVQTEAQEHHILQAIIAAESALKHTPDDPDLQDLILDLYRARKAWEQVIQISDTLLTKKSHHSAYSREELKRIRAAAARALSLAYESLLRIPSLDSSRKNEFRRMGHEFRILGNLDPGKPIPFKVIPELEPWIVWPS